MATATLNETTAREPGCFHGLSDEQVAEHLTLDDVIADEQMLWSKNVELMLGVDSQQVEQAMNIPNRAGDPVPQKIRDTRCKGNHPHAPGHAIKAWIRRMSVDYTITPAAARAWRQRHPAVDQPPPSLLDLADQARQDATATAEDGERAEAQRQRERDLDALAQLLARHDRPHDDDPATLADLMDRLGYDRRKIESLCRIIDEHRRLSDVVARAEQAKQAIAPAQAKLDALLNRYSKQLTEIKQARHALTQRQAAVASLQRNQQIERAQGLRNRAPWLFTDEADGGLPTLRH